MHALSLRPVLAPVLGALICFLVAPRPGAALRQGPLQRFSARAVSVVDNKDVGPIDILVDHWSNNTERDALQHAFIDQGVDTLLPMLHRLHGRAGVVLLPGVQSLGTRVRTRTPKNLLFARESVTKTGRQLVFIADQHVGFGEPAIYSRAELQEFNLLDIRIGPDGKGVGKLAGADKVTYNQRTRMFEVKDYGALPARLVDVHVEKMTETR
jgi:hypothetical protein